MDHLHEKKPTLADLAREAGVSRSAASMALNGRPGIGKQTRERVRRVAEAMGYFTHPVLAGLAASRFKGKDFIKAAVLVRSQQAHQVKLGMNLAESLNRLGSPLGFRFELVDTCRFPEPGTLERYLQDSGILALVISFVPHDPAFLKAFKWEHFVAVKTTREKTDPEFSLVRSSYFQPAVRAVNYLQQRGCKNLAAVLMRPSPNRADLQKQAAAIQWAMNGSVEDIFCFVEGFADLDENYRRIAAWLGEKQPDAVIAMHYGLALQVSEAMPAIPRSRILALEGAGSGFGGFGGSAPALELETVHLLSLLCKGSQFGPPQQPLEITVMPQWIDPGAATLKA